MILGLGFYFWVDSYCNLMTQIGVSQTGSTLRGVLHGVHMQGSYVGVGARSLGLRAVSK